MVTSWDPTPIYHQLCAEMLVDPLPTDRAAVTAGHQDHSDPWVYAGHEAPPPEDPE